MIGRTLKFGNICQLKVLLLIFLNFLNIHNHNLWLCLPFLLSLIWFLGNISFVLAIRMLMHCLLFMLSFLVLHLFSVLLLLLKLLMLLLRLWKFLFLLILQCLIINLLIFISIILKLNYFFLIILKLLLHQKSKLLNHL